jgi:hypothetical protein
LNLRIIDSITTRDTTAAKGMAITAIVLYSLKKETIFEGRCS